MINGRIDNKGILYIDRVNIGLGEEVQYCIDSSINCGTQCPMFGDISSKTQETRELPPYYTLTICQGRTLTFKEFKVGGKDV